MYWNNNCNSIEKESVLFIMYLSYPAFIVDQICMSGQNLCRLIAEKDGLQSGKQSLSLIGLGL